MANLTALQSGTELVGDYRIDRVLGAGGFGITYLAEELALHRQVTIKEYFPTDFAARGSEFVATPRSENCSGDYAWGLDRFIEEAQTLARFRHPNIVQVYRYFRANNTGYMVLHFEEGQSLKSWLKTLGRSPRQKELDQIIKPLLDALEAIHVADFLHRDIAPDNIIIRKDGMPVLIDFGSARREIASHSKTVSALVKPGYSPYEQYAETSRQQGPWTDIYALAATLYHVVTGKRPADAPSRMVKDDLVPALEAAVGGYRQGFLRAIDKALNMPVEARPQSIAAWRGDLLAPDAKQPSWLQRTVGKNAPKPHEPPDPAPPEKAATVLPPPDMPGAPGRILAFVDSLKKQTAGKHAPAARAKADVKADSAAKASAAKASAPQPEKRADGPVGTAKLSTGELPPRLPRILQRKPAASKAIALPAGPAVIATPAAGKRTPQPKRIKSVRRGWAPLAFKLLVGVGVASGAVALQDRLPRLENRGSGDTSSTTITGSISDTRSAPVLPVGQLQGHASKVTAVAYTADGSTLVTAGADQTLKIWNSASSSLARTIELDDGAATAIAVEGVRALTAHGNGTVVLWDIDRAEKLGAFKKVDLAVAAVAFIGGADRFAASYADGSISLWDAATTSAPVHSFNAHDTAADALAFVITEKGPVLISGGRDLAVKMWDLDTFERVRTYRGQRDAVSAVAASAGGKTVASAGVDGKLRIWSARSTRLLRSLSGHNGRANAIVFAPSGDVIASAGDDGKVRVWDYNRRRTPKTLPSHTGAVTAIAFSPDGQRIASAGDDGMVRIWDNPVFKPLTN